MAPWYRGPPDIVEDLIAHGVNSGRKRCFLADGAVMREVARYSRPTTATTRSGLVSGVKSLTVTRVGGMVTVHATVDFPIGGENTPEFVPATLVWLRN